MYLIVDVSVIAYKKEEEKKVGQGKGVENILKDLNEEFDGFKMKYNEQGLREIFNKQPNDLLNKQSNLNKNYDKYKENMDKICVMSKSFNKYIQDIGGIMKKLSTPDVKHYKSWNVKQILCWIQTLENGQFSPHIDKLRVGLTRSKIIGEDLPELTRTDLSASPFNIDSFRVRKQLEGHFKSLLGGGDVGIALAAVNNNEGAPTAYI